MKLNVPPKCQHVPSLTVLHRLYFLVVKARYRNDCTWLTKQLEPMGVSLRSQENHIYSPVTKTYYVQLSASLKFSFWSDVLSMNFCHLLTLTITWIKSHVFREMQFFFIPISSKINHKGHIYRNALIRPFYLWKPI